MTDSDLTEPPSEPAALTMNDLEVVIGRPDLLPPGLEVQPMGMREFKLRAPGMRDWIRVSTNPTYYEQHADAMELWSPGNPTFPQTDQDGTLPHTITISELLAG